MNAIGIEIVRERRWRATVPTVLQYRGNCSQEEGCEGERAAARVGGCWERRPRGFSHGRQERRDFLLISYLIRLICLLSLYREVYLTLKQVTN